MENSNFNNKSYGKLIDEIIIDDEEITTTTTPQQPLSPKQKHTRDLPKIFLPPSKTIKHGGIEEHLELLKNNKLKEQQRQTNVHEESLVPEPSSLLIPKKISTEPNNFKRYYLDEDEFKDMRQTVDDLRRLMLQSKSIQDRMLLKTEKIQNDLDPTKEKINWRKIVK